jgi:hypothetical protein
MAVSAHGGALAQGRGHSIAPLATVGLGAIWAAVVVISALSPDSVTGSEQQHVPIAAVLTWMWGLVASRSLVTTLVAQRDHPDRYPGLRLLVAGVAAAWAVAAVVAITAPEIVTGSDPTRIPIWAILAPVASLLVTTTACQIYSSLQHR